MLGGIAAAAAAAVLVAIGAFLALRPGPPPEPTPRTSTSIALPKPSKGEALARALAYAEDYAKRHPAEFAEIIAKFEQVAREGKESVHGMQAEDRSRTWRTKWEGAAQAELDKRRQSADLREPLRWEAQKARKAVKAARAKCGG